MPALKPPRKRASAEQKPIVEGNHRRLWVAARLHKLIPRTPGRLCDANAGERLLAELNFETDRIQVVGTREAENAREPLQPLEKAQFVTLVISA